MKRPDKAAVTGILIAAAVLLLAGCAGDQYLQSTVDPKSDFAEGIHRLYIDVFWWTMGILVVVWGALAYTLFRFKERPGDPRPEQNHGNMTLEIAWTVAPAIIVVLITIPTIRGVFETQRPVSADALTVEVTGKRFFWHFYYPEFGVTTSNELVLPVDRPVNLRLESADVIHSFWIPKLGGKRDVQPIPEVREGENKRYNYLYFTPNETGVYWGQCAEFCGDSHALMGMRAIVKTQSDFEQWVEDWQTPAPTAMAPVPDTIDGVVQPVTEDPQVALGRDVFFNQSFCTSCHAVGGTPGTLNAVGPAGQPGPNLTRMGSRTSIAAGQLENTAENLVRWIRDPISIKPGSLMPGVDQAAGGWPETNLTEEQMEALAAYLLSMR